jgi:hypothetical protein
MATPSKKVKHNLNIDKDGVLHVVIRNFGNNKKLTKSRDKLDFIVTVLYFKGFYDFYISDFYPRFYPDKKIKKNASIRELLDESNYYEDVIEENLIENYDLRPEVKEIDVTIQEPLVMPDFITRGNVDFDDILSRLQVQGDGRFGSFLNALLSSDWTILTGKDGKISIDIGRKGLTKNKIPLDEHGFLISHFGNFGKQSRDYQDPSDKLSYLMTNVAYMAGVAWDTGNWDERLETIYNHYMFHEIANAICGYTGANGIKIVGPTEPEIDHQMHPYGSIEVLDSFQPYDIVNFVYNRNIILHTDCD